MKRGTKHISTQKQPESHKQFEADKRQPWQRPLLQRLNLSLDTAFTAGSTDDTMTFRP